MKRPSRAVCLAFLGLVLVACAAFLVVRLAFGTAFPTGAIVIPRDLTLEEALAQVGPDETLYLQALGSPYAGGFVIDVPRVTLLAQRGVEIVSPAGSPAITLRADGVEVRGLAIRADGVGVHVESDGCTLVDLTVDAASVVVRMVEARSCTLERLRLRGGEIGIEATACYGNRIVDVRIDGIRIAGIRLEGGVGNAILGCDIRDGAFGLEATQGASDTVVRECTFVSCADAGVVFRGGDGNEVHDSILSDVGHGIVLDGATGHVLRGCTIRAAAVAGVTLLDSPQNRLIEIRVEESAADGIRVSNSPENYIAFGVLLDCIESGVWLDGSEGSTLVSNHAASNRRGIWVVGSPSVRLLRNHLVGSTRAGMHLAGSPAARLLDNVIVGGIVGILLEPGSDEAVLVRNRVSEARLVGMALLRGSDRVRVEESRFLDQPLGLLVDEGIECSLRDNTVASNETGVLLHRSGLGLALRGNRFVENNVGLTWAESIELLLEELRPLGVSRPNAVGIGHTPIVVHNTFVGNETADIRNQTDRPLSAGQNWWDTEEPVLDGPILLSPSSEPTLVAVGTTTGETGELLGRLTQRALEDAGFGVIDLAGLGRRSEVLDAFDSGDVDVIWISSPEQSVGIDDDGRVIDSPLQTGWVAMGSTKLGEGLGQSSLTALFASVQTDSRRLRFAIPERFGSDAFSRFLIAYAATSIAEVTWVDDANEAEAMAKLGRADIVLVDRVEQALAGSGFVLFEDDAGVLERVPYGIVVSEDALARHPDLLFVLQALGLRVDADVLSDGLRRIRLLGTRWDDVVRDMLRLPAEDGRDTEGQGS